MDMWRGQYMSSLLEDAKNRDPNSFAIIFAITYEKLYDECKYYTRREYNVQDILFETYVTAYEKISTLKKAKLLPYWLDTIFRDKASEFLHKKVGYVRKKTLKSILFKDKQNSTMTLETAEQLLDSIFMQVGSESHSVPIESLLAYHKYRSSKSYLQKFLILMSLSMLLIFPFFGVKPLMTVTAADERSTSNQSHYIIDVDCLIPMRTVIAKINGKDVTVMIEGDKIYEATAMENGPMVVTATAVNGKKVSIAVNVTNIDKIKPLVSDYSVEGGQLKVYVHDADSGINYNKCAIIRHSDSSVHMPLEHDSTTGYMLFDFYENDSSLVIYDRANNKMAYTFSK